MRDPKTSFDNMKKNIEKIQTNLKKIRTRNVNFDLSTSFIKEVKVTSSSINFKKPVSRQLQMRINQHRSQNLSPMRESSPRQFPKICYFMREQRFDKGPIAKIDVQPFIEKYKETKFKEEGIPKLLELIIYEF